MPDRLKAVAFDLDAASLISLREALPEWEIEVLIGATATSLTHDWNAGEADLLVVKACEEVAETLALCRFLVSCGVFSADTRQDAAVTLGLHGSRQKQARRTGAPLLVLVSSGQGPLVRAALEAGADSCLVLPVRAKEVASMLARVGQGNRLDRHTLNLDRAQCEDRWRDDGGQGESYEVETISREFAGQRPPQGTRLPRIALPSPRNDEVGHRSAFKGALSKPNKKAISGTNQNNTLRQAFQPDKPVPAGSKA